MKMTLVVLHPCSFSTLNFTADSGHNSTRRQKIMEDEARLFVCNIPDGCGMFTVKKAIDVVLSNNDALVEIDFVKKEDGTKIPGVYQILLQNAECKYLCN